MKNQAPSSDSELLDFLEKIPLFSTIPLVDLKKLAPFFEAVFAEKGDIIFSEGDPGDAMYIIKSGSVGVYVGREGSEGFVSDLHRGDFFGEMSLITGRARMSTIKVILDAQFYRLQHHHFERLLKENPVIGLNLSRHFAHRFAQSRNLSLNEPLPAFFAVIATHPKTGKSHFLYSVAYHLAHEAKKRVLIVEFVSQTKSWTKNYEMVHAECPDDDLKNIFSEPYAARVNAAWFSHRAGFMAFEMPVIEERKYWEEFVTHLPHLMDLLRKSFDTVFFNIPHPGGNIEKRVLRLCDRVLVLIANTDRVLPEVKKKISEIGKFVEDRFDIIKCGVSHLIGKRGIARDKLETELNLAETPAIWVDRTPEAIADRIDTRPAFPVRGARALARELGRIRVGLVLGAGSARGWAHLGVLKVLEEAGVHIDMIAGSSIGALIGSIYAKTASADETKRLTIDEFPTRMQARRKIFDLTVPTRGIIRGQKVLQMVNTALQDADFLDLQIPLYIVAVDAQTGEEVLFEKGKVSKAVRASISIPGIFTPYYFNNRWFLDGGILNPIPTDVLIQKGADIVISVCIEHESNHRDPKSRRSPTMIGVLSKTVNIVHSRAAGNFAKQSDIVLYPRVGDFAWDDFHRGPELMKAGIKVCRRHIDEIKRLVYEKSHVA
ncbi:MAG: cyclic nucleotide-binding and patatin-like phospholipase domain-containing protein [Desulfobacterales bacterium]